MENLVLEIQKAKLELAKHEALLLEFCRNNYYDLKWRFKVWEEVANKKQYKHGLDFKHGTHFENAVPICIRGYDGFDAQPGDESTYEELITHVIENILENIPEHVISDELKEELVNNNPKLAEVKEWIMLENLGSWR